MQFKREKTRYELNRNYVIDLIYVNVFNEMNKNNRTYKFIEESNQKLMQTEQKSWNVNFVEY
jgi:hypothetical protein